MQYLFIFAQIARAAENAVSRCHGPAPPSSRKNAGFCIFCSSLGSLWHFSDWKIILFNRILMWQKENEWCRPETDPVGCWDVYFEQWGVKSRSISPEITFTFTFTATLSHLLWDVLCSAVLCSIGSTTGCTITEKAPTSAFTFKTLLRHYAKWALTPR